MLSPYQAGTVSRWSGVRSAPVRRGAAAWWILCEHDYLRHRQAAYVTRLDPIERAVADIAAGKAVVVVDDEDRENEGDLIFAAE